MEKAPAQTPIVFNKPVDFGKPEEPQFDFTKRKLPKKKLKPQEELQKVEVEYKDISQKSSVSIFKMISSRYLKSALPSFFDRKEKNEIERKKSNSK